MGGQRVTDPGFLHVVAYRERDGVALPRRDEMASQLAALVGVIPGLTSALVATNASTLGFEDGFSLVLLMTFESAADRNAYIDHPAHVACLPIVEEVTDALIVVGIDKPGSVLASANRTDDAETR